MGRRPRDDENGAWHHVMNRALARRPLFEDRQDIRYFLSRLAREVRKGTLEIHCWCVLTTHFHLLVRSPKGELSDAIRNAQHAYTRFFNRKHKRDGPLIKGRCTSKRVRSKTYRRLLVGYINKNPVAAGMAELAPEYPYGSANQWSTGRIPKWLSQAWLSADAALSILPHQGAELVESCIKHMGSGHEDLDELVGAAPQAMQSWLQRKAKLADGAAIGLPVCGRSSVLKALQSCTDSLPIRVGMLRTLTRLQWREISTITRQATTTCHRQYTLHNRRLIEDPMYAQHIATIATLAMAICHTSLNRDRSRLPGSPPAR
jgi:REP element-mobilizing transposase RayT